MCALSQQWVNDMVSHVPIFSNEELAKLEMFQCLFQLAIPDANNVNIITDWHFNTMGMYDEAAVVEAMCQYFPNYLAQVEAEYWLCMKKMKSSQIHMT